LGLSPITGLRVGVGGKGAMTAGCITDGACQRSDLVIVRPDSPQEGLKDFNNVSTHKKSSANRREANGVAVGGCADDATRLFQIANDGITTGSVIGEDWAKSQLNGHGNFLFLGSECSIW
jgi:hypothetical protein